MRIKIFAAVDTNVIVSSVISQTGFPKNIIEYIDKRNIIPIFDKRMLDEYYKVLHYDKFNIEEMDIYDVLYKLIKNGILAKDVAEAKEILVDKDDIPFFEVKLSTEEFDSYLITGNKKHFPESPSIVSPKEMISIMNYLDKFLSRDINYDDAITNLMENELATNRYTSGTKLLNKIFDSENKRVKDSYFR